MRGERDDDEDSVEEETTFALSKFRKVFRCSTILLNVCMCVSACVCYQSK